MGSRAPGMAPFFLIQIFFKMACKTCSAMAGIGRIRRKSSNMKGNSFQKKAIGGGIALILEYALMDKVVTTKNLAYGQAAVGAAGFFFLKNPMLKTASLATGVLGAAKAFTGKNLVTQAAISGVTPYYRISGTNPVMREGNGSVVENFV